MREMQPEDIAPAGPGSSDGATGIFGVVKQSSESTPGSGAAKEVTAAPSAPAEATTLPAAAQAAEVKTQEVIFRATDHPTFEDTDALRRILESSRAPVNVPAPPVADGSGAGGFTQLLRSVSPHSAIAIDVTSGAGASRAADASAKSREVPTGGEAVHQGDATASSLPSMRETPAPPSVPGAAQTDVEESFTQMFGVPAVPSQTAVPRVEPAQAQNVGFTQLFQAFKSSAGERTAPSSSPLVPGSNSGPATPPGSAVGSEASARVVAPLVPEDEHARSAEHAVFSQPVSLPELAREILHEVDGGASPDGSPGVASGSAPEVRSQPVGSFTQLFQTLARPGAQVVREPAAGSPGPSSPGDPGSFTQLFSSSMQRPSAQGTQADSFPPLSPSSSAGQERFTGGEAFRPSPPVESSMSPDYRRPMPAELYPGSPPPPSSNAPEGGGEMTRLLRRLDSASSTPPAAAPFNVEPLPSPPPEVGRMTSAAEGATVAFRMPETRVTSAVPAPGGQGNAGHGGVTQILNASALRESLRRGVGNEVPAAMPPAVPPAAPTTGGGFPAMPGYPPMPAMQMPSMPPSTQMTPGSPHPMQMPQLPQMPQVPQVPQMQVPRAEASAAPSGGKSWVPILLMVIIVLLVGILLAVVLLMKK